MNVLFAFHRPLIQIQSVDPEAVRRGLNTWLETTANDTKQLLAVVIDNINSVRTIHNVNKAVSELGKFTNTCAKRESSNTNCFFS